MSYRTLKRLLGETSLERKCRFLFGGGLFLLITGSFYFYARLNTNLVYDQNETTARSLITPIILEKHWKWSEPEQVFKNNIDAMVGELRPADLKGFEWKLWPPDPTKKDAERPDDDAGYEAISRLRAGEEKVIERFPEKGVYHYYAPVKATKSCMECHSVRTPGLQENDLLGVVKVKLPLSNTRQQVSRNNAILLLFAIGTAFIAMVAAYAIVRYVIVKPVLHLKDVSDEIARGNLDQRADIRTGDEFEELSHAFNRMLRHLVTVQDELREVNTDLDGKVDELAQVNLQLYEMNKIKDEFLATMSHELRTPLNSILGFSEVLTGADNITDKQKRFLDNIRTSGFSLMQMINDILDLAKIESGKMDMQPVDFSAADCIERQVGSLMPLAQKKEIDLSWQVVDDIPILFQDIGKIQQILNNLLSNAIKFTPEGGRIQVYADMVSSRILSLKVTDTGVGIPLEDQATIFEKFRQGKAIPGQENPMTREYGGTGLGLSIVKELSKFLGGEVTLDSEFGKGSTFIVCLPARLESSHDSDGRPTAGSPGGRIDGQVLISDASESKAGSDPSTPHDENAA
jgi:two-component system sensor histidine kinase BarA